MSEDTPKWVILIRKRQDQGTDHWKIHRYADGNPIRFDEMEQAIKSMKCSFFKKAKNGDTRVEREDRLDDEICY